MNDYQTYQMLLNLKGTIVPTKSLIRALKANGHSYASAREWIKAHMGVSENGLTFGGLGVRAIYRFRLVAYQETVNNYKEIR